MPSPFTLRPSQAIQKQRPLIGHKAQIMIYYSLPEGNTKRKKKIKTQLRPNFVLHLFFDH